MIDSTNYDPLLKCATLTNGVELMEFINLVSPRKVIVESVYASLRGIMFSAENGEEIAYNNIPSVFNGLSESFELDLNLSMCHRRGRVYKLYFNKHPEMFQEEQASDVAVEPVIDVPSLDTISTDEPDSLVVDAASLESTLAEETSVEATKPTLKELESIYDASDKAGSKNKLEDVIKEAYGIDLRKNQTFKNMLVELETTLEEQALAAVAK